MRSSNLPSLEQCITRRIYKLRSRNLIYGVYDARGGFIGIRTKFGKRYLFIEYHWDYSQHYGTVTEAIDLNVDLPKNVSLNTCLGTIDYNSQREVIFDKPILDGGKGWYFKDNGQSDPDILPTSVENKLLFDFLDSIEKGNF